VSNSTVFRHEVVVPGLASKADEGGGRNGADDDTGYGSSCDRCCLSSCIIQKGTQNSTLASGRAEVGALLLRAVPGGSVGGVDANRDVASNVGDGADTGDGDTPGNVIASRREAIVGGVGASLGGAVPWGLDAGSIRGVAAHEGANVGGSARNRSVHTQREVVGGGVVAGVDGAVQSVVAVVGGIRAVQAGGGALHRVHGARVAIVAVGRGQGVAQAGGDIAYRWAASRTARNKGVLAHTPKAGILRAQVAIIAVLGGRFASSGGNVASCGEAQVSGGTEGIIVAANGSRSSHSAGVESARIAITAVVGGQHTASLGVASVRVASVRGVAGDRGVVTLVGGERAVAGVVGAQVLVVAAHWGGGTGRGSVVAH